MERLAPFELSLPFIKNIHIYIYTVPYTFNHLVHSNTTLYCIYIYIHYLFSMFISNNNEFFINCSLQWILAFHSSSFSEAGLVAERGYTFRARRWRTIRWWRYTGAGTQRDALVWRCLEILKKMTAVGFSKIRESLKQFLCQWGYMISILYILKSIQINYNPNVYVSARHRFHHTFSIVYVQIW